MTNYYADINPYFGVRGQKKFRVFYKLFGKSMLCAYQSNSKKLAEDRAAFMTKNSTNDPKFGLSAEAKANL